MITTFGEAEVGGGGLAAAAECCKGLAVVVDEDTVDSINELAVVVDEGAAIV